MSIIVLIFIKMNLKKVFRKYKNEFKVPNTATSTGGISFYQHVVFNFFTDKF